MYRLCDQDNRHLYDTVLYYSSEISLDVGILVLQRHLLHYLSFIHWKMFPNSQPISVLQAFPPLGCAAKQNGRVQW
jgi:hypothetical protein